MFENVTETQKLQEIIFSANVFMINRDEKMFKVCVCVCMDSLFSYILCFSLDMCIKFDPFLHLTSLSATSICTSPASGQQKKRFSTVDVHISVVSKAAGPLYLGIYWTKQSKGLSISPTCQHMGKKK